MTFKANFGGIATAASDIAGGANKIEQQLNDMDGRLQPLKSDWTGAASQSYEQARAEWTKAITEINGILRQLGTVTDQGGQDYQQTETNNANRFA